MLKKLLKQKRVPILGELVDSLFSTLPLLSVYSGITMTILLYTSTRAYLHSWFPWIELWSFILIILFSLIPLLLLTYKFIIPSLWGFRSKQMFHLEDKIKTLEQKLDKILENTNSKEKDNERSNSTHTSPE